QIESEGRSALPTPTIPCSSAHQLLAPRTELGSSPPYPSEDRCHRDGNQPPLHDYQSQRIGERSRQMVRPPWRSRESHQRIETRYVRGSVELPPLPCKCGASSASYDCDLVDDLLSSIRSGQHGFGAGQSGFDSHPPAQGRRASRANRATNPLSYCCP